MRGRCLDRLSWLLSLLSHAKSTKKIVVLLWLLLLGWLLLLRLRHETKCTASTWLLLLLGRLRLAAHLHIGEHVVLLLGLLLLLCRLHEVEATRLGLSRGLGRRP